jgi:hypothetical protein
MTGYIWHVVWELCHRLLSVFLGTLLVRDMCVCVCVCVNTHTYHRQTLAPKVASSASHKSIHIHTCPHTYTYTYNTFSRAQALVTSLSTYVHIHIHIHTHTHIQHVQSHPKLPKCLSQVCQHTYISTHIHTHIQHAQSHPKSPKCSSQESPGPSRSHYAKICARWVHTALQVGPTPPQACVQTALAATFPTLLARLNVHSARRASTRGISTCLSRRAHCVIPGKPP